MPTVFGFYMAARAVPPLRKRIYLTYPPMLLARLVGIFWRFTRFTCVNHTPYPLLRLVSLLHPLPLHPLPYPLPLYPLYYGGHIEGRDSPSPDFLPSKQLL